MMFPVHVNMPLLLINQESYTRDYFAFDWFHNPGKLELVQCDHVIRTLIDRTIRDTYGSQLHRSV